MLVLNRFQPNWRRGDISTVNDLVIVCPALAAGLNFCETSEHLDGSDHLMIRLQFVVNKIVSYFSLCGLELKHLQEVDDVLVLTDKESTDTASEASGEDKTSGSVPNVASAVRYSNCGFNIL